MVYVLDINGNPLMPTERHGKVRRLLKEGKAKVVKRCPFTIQLLYDSTKYVQEINLGIDAGSKHIGVSATTNGKVLYEAPKARIMKAISTETASGITQMLKTVIKEVKSIDVENYIEQFGLLKDGKIVVATYGKIIKIMF